MGRKTRKILLSVGSFLLAALLCFGLFDTVMPGIFSISAARQTFSLPCACLSSGSVTEESASLRQNRLFGVVGLKKIETTQYEGLSLIPGGMAFGVKMLTDGVLTVGMTQVVSGGKQHSPAADAGVCVKDVIIAINGSPVKTVSDLSRAVQNSQGKTLALTCRRGDQTVQLNLTPVLSDTDGKYRSGLWVRDTSSGIGTVTFIVPQTGAFGALGHGICDADTGALVPLSRGTVSDVSVDRIIKGADGAPGELCGTLLPSKIGSVLNNTHSGIYGVLTQQTASASEAVPIGTADTVRPGKATVLCTLDGDGVKPYEIEILTVNKRADDRSFTIRVTDPALLAKTGGIVQGMSGSPIIQNGRLIGAMTHVLIHDPTGGYGIFIENMLDDMPASLK